MKERERSIAFRIPRFLTVESLKNLQDTRSHFIPVQLSEPRLLVMVSCRNSIYVSVCHAGPQREWLRMLLNDPMTNV